MHSDSRTHRFPPKRQNHTLTRVRLERFTAFKHLDLELHAGINVFVGANGTGKTHLLKAAYVACECARMDHDTITEVRVHDKLVQVFLPSGGDIGRLIQHPRDGRAAVMEVWHGDRKLRIPVFDDLRQFDSIDDAGWSSDAINALGAGLVLSESEGQDLVWRTA